MKNPLSSLLILFLPAVYHCQSIDHSVISSFGIDYTDATFQTECTVGEGITLTGEIENTFITQGFHQPVSMVALCQIPHEETIAVSGCAIVELNGEIYNLSGNFTQMLIADDGCDSLLYVNVTLNTLSNETISIDNAVMAIQENANYTWTLCGEEVVLSTSQIFVPSESGDYQVTITQEECEVVSECISFEVNVEEMTPSIELLLFPNPSQDLLHVQLRGVKGECSFTVYDSFGRAILSSQMTNPSTKFNVEELAVGTYLFVVHANNSIFTQSFVKV